MKKKRRWLLGNLAFDCNRPKLVGRLVQFGEKRAVIRLDDGRTLQVPVERVRRRTGCQSTSMPPVRVQRKAEEISPELQELAEKAKASRVRRSA